MSGREEGQTIDASAEVALFLVEAARAAQATESDVLARVLGAHPVTAHEGFATFAGRMNTSARDLIVMLDRQLRVANPGTQLVFRQEYIGYRRFDPRVPIGANASRSQVYASLLPRRAFVRLILPVDVPRESPRVKDLSGKGHHGIGDAALDIRTPEDIEIAMTLFESWLGPRPYGAEHSGSGG